MKLNPVDEKKLDLESRLHYIMLFTDQETLNQKKLCEHLQSLADDYQTDLPLRDAALKLIADLPNVTREDLYTRVFELFRIAYA